MTKMPTEMDAVDLGTVHPEACVIVLRDRMGERLPEARPTGVAVILRRRREDLQVTSHTGIRARPRLEVELTGEGNLCTLPSQHLVGRRARAPRRGSWEPCCFVTRLAQCGDRPGQAIQDSSGNVIRGRWCQLAPTSLIARRELAE
jgi:hypothetical protein